MEYLLKIEGVTAGYHREVDVLHEVSLNLLKGTTTCIIGPNGAGKSTLMKTICGFLKPRKGKILFNGEDITGLKPHSSTICCLLSILS